MRRKFSIHSVVVAAAAAHVLTVAGLPASRAQESAHGHGAHAQTEARTAEPKGPNGGNLSEVGPYRVETIVQPKGILCMAYDGKGQLIQPASGSGTLQLKVGASEKTFTYRLLQLKNGAIGVPLDLSKVEGKELHLEVALQGVGTEPLVFNTTVSLSNSLSDALLIGLQKTCPVSGQSLGSMGTPPKIMLGDRPLFVCCEACTATLKASPEKYLSKYYKAQGAQVRPGVFEATLADAEAIAAQGTCPVMDEKLGSMGVPQKVNVNGKAVYICCAGCAKKLHSEPQDYLSKLAKAGVTPPDMQ